MKKARKLELENAVLREVIAKVREQVRRENLEGEYSYPEAVGAIIAITDEQSMENDIQRRIHNEEFWGYLKLTGRLETETWEYLKLTGQLKTETPAGGAARESR